MGGMSSTTVGVSPKAVAATVSALVVPFLAKILGVDEAGLLGLVTAVVTALVAYAAPPGTVGDPELAGTNVAVEDAAATDTVIPDIDDVDSQPDGLPLGQLMPINSTRDAA